MSKENKTFKDTSETGELSSISASFRISLIAARDRLNVISPPGFSRQAYVMLLLLFSFFLTIAWSNEILETTRSIFTKFSGMGDMLV